VEGEKDVDRLARLNVPATCNSEGAGKWRDELTRHFEGARVVILRDNDEAGRAHGLDVAEKLKGTAAEIRILDLPDLAEKGDVSDWLDAGHTVEELWQLVETKAAGPEETARPEPNEPLPGLRPLCLSEDEDRIEPRQWLLGTTFCRGFLSALAGAGAVGKTAIRMLQVLSIGTGREFTGEHVFEQCPVLFVCFEDNLDELRRRFRAATMFYELKKEELANIYILSVKKFRIAATDPKSKSVTKQPLYDKLVKLILELKIGLVVFDPFVKLHDADENANAAMDTVAGILIELAEECNCATDILHHVKKGVTNAGDADASRGASSIMDAARLVRTATAMTSEEARTLGVDEESRRAFVRVEIGKVNLAPGKDTVWFELVGVNLDNGTDRYPNGDNVQTVKRWRPADKLIGGIAAHIAEMILDAIDKGRPDGSRYSAAPQAKGDASIVNAFHAVNRNYTRPEAFQIYAALRKEGHVYEVQIKDQHRKWRPAVFVKDGKVKPTMEPGYEPEDESAPSSEK
jgi:hypothetical protein